MRIVGGSHRGRKIEAPAGRDVRPTSDRARESLFNILMHSTKLGDDAPSLDGAIVLDAFAGSGALGFEALSRGAAHATFLDSDFAALRVIKTNAETLGVAPDTTILKADATKPTRATRAADFVFLDPPYGQDLAASSLAALASAGWIAPGAVVSVELGPDDAFETPESFVIVDERKYGKARIVLLRYR
jgi:16S rRNA (guanine966-N2)-methyltransferase